VAKRNRSAPQPKRADVMAEVARHVNRGTLLFTGHAIESMEIDNIEQDDVLHALRNGARAERHDEYSSTYSTWNYSIHGSSPDGCRMRVVVTFRMVEMVVVTAFEL
jgi:hypothetical protein